MTNWKTTLTGIATIILAALGPVLDHYHPYSGLSWTQTLLSIAAVVGGTGLIAAKDSTTHSTVAQVHESTEEARVTGK